jgi:hypothetical protein
MVRVVIIDSKQAMASFARAHEDTPVTWSTSEGPGGTIIIHEECDE